MASVDLTKGRFADVVSAVWRELSQLVSDFSRASTVDDVALSLSRSAERLVGEEFLRYGLMGLAVLGTVAVIWASFGLYRLMFGTMVNMSPTTASQPKTGGKQDKKGVAGKSQPAESTPAEADSARPQQAAAAPSPAATAASTAVSSSKRTRSSTATDCKGLKGLPLLGASGVSPDGMIMVASSREKRVVRVFPMFRGLLDQVKAYKGFTDLPESAVPASAVVTHVAFANAGQLFALVDTVDKSVYSFAYSASVDTAPADEPTVNVTFLGRRAVPRVNAARADAFTLSDDGRVLVAFTEADGVITAFDLSSGAELGNAKVKAGNRAVWAAAAGGRVACAGSYIHDIRVQQLQMRGSGSAAVALAPIASIPVPARVDRLAFSPDGTRLVAVAEGGHIRVWDLDVNLALEEKPKLLAEWTDADYFAPTAVSIAFYQPRSGTRRRDLGVLLVQGGDFVAYVLPSAHQADKIEPPRRVCEVFGAHDGAAVQVAHFACRGGAIVTAVDMDPRNIVRLWPLSSGAAA